MPPSHATRRVRGRNLGVHIVHIAVALAWEWPLQARGILYVFEVATATIIPTLPKEMLH